MDQFGGCDRDFVFSFRGELMKNGDDFCTCKICGEHIGKGFNHIECSKINQEKSVGVKRRKNVKTLGKKQIDYLSKIR